MHKDNDHRLITTVVNEKRKKKKKNPTQICCDGVNTAILVCKGNKFVERKMKGSVRVVLLFRSSPWTKSDCVDATMPVPLTLYTLKQTFRRVSFFVLLLVVNRGTSGSIKKGENRRRLCTDTVCCRRVVTKKTKKTELMKYLAPTTGVGKPF